MDAQRNKNFSSLRAREDENKNSKRHAGNRQTGEFWMTCPFKNREMPQIIIMKKNSDKRKRNTFFPIPSRRRKRRDRQTEKKAIIALKGTATQKKRVCGKNEPRRRKGGIKNKNADLDKCRPEFCLFIICFLSQNSERFCFLQHEKHRPGIVWEKKRPACFLRPKGREAAGAGSVHLKFHTLETLSYGEPAFCFLPTPAFLPGQTHESR